MRLSNLESWISRMLTTVFLASMLLAFNSRVEAQEDPLDQFLSAQRQSFRSLKQDEVIESCSKQLTITGRENRPLIFAVRSFAHAWKLDEAAFEDVDQALRGNPSDSRVWAFCGMAMSYMNEHQRALECAKKAIQLDANSSLSHHAMGFVRYMYGEAVLSLESVETAIQLSPDMPENYWLKASIQSGLDLDADAATCLEQAIKLDGNFASALIDRGYTRFMEGNTKGGLEDFARAERLTTLKSIVPSIRGLARVAVAVRESQPNPEMLQSGLADIDQAVKISPTRPSVLRNRAYVLAVTKKYDEAIKVAEQAIKLCPNEIAGYLRIAQIYDLSGDQTTAVRYLKKGIQISPKLHKTYMYLGLMEQLRGNEDAAISAFSQALDRYPKHEYSLYFRADLHVKAMRYNDAIKDYARLIELKPRAGIYYWERGEAYDKIGEQSKANQDKQKARQLGYRPLSPQP